MITGMERLSAALRGAVSDRIPVFCNLIDQGAEELGMTPQDYFSSGEHVAEGQLRLREKYGYDNLWSLFYVGREAELVGCRKIHYERGGPPNVEDFVIRRYDDVGRLQIPDDLLSAPAFQEERRCLEILKREAGGSYPVCAYISSSMTLPALLMGMEQWMELLFFGPLSVREELLAKCHDLFVKEIAAYRACGADVLLYSNPFGSTDTVPLAYFMEHSLPWIEKDIAAAGAEGIVYYCGMSNFGKVLGTVLDRTGISAYYLGPGDDPAESCRVMAGRALACGVINDIRLVDWTEEEIRREVKRIISAGRACGKFLFGTGLMPCAIPERNIRVMLEAAYEFGSRGAVL